MAQAIDIVGRKYGKLTAIRFTGERHSNGHRIWLFACDCGATINATANNVSRGNTKSCGCGRYRKGERHHGYRHGMYRTPTHTVWANMVQRCTDPSHKSWPNYGGRGITVCERWLSFANFLADMGERPSGETLDRKDNAIGYCPGNCRWATYTAQNNNRRSNVCITFDGLTLTIAQWSARVGLSQKTIHYRRSHGWSDEDALTKPVTRSLR